MSVPNTGSAAVVYVRQLLCGCSTVEDEVGRVLSVETCPWCMQLRRVDIEAKMLEVDSIVSVSALDEDEEVLRLYSDKIKYLKGLGGSDGGEEGCGDA